LQKNLPQRFAKIEDVHLDMNVRKIQLKNDIASVIYHYSMSFRMPSLSSKVRTESDIKEMLLRREQGQWKITSGV